MGQKMAKKELTKAEIFYNDQRFDEAAQSWIKALKYVKEPVERFSIAGKICGSLCDVGKYRDALLYAGLQCEIANTLDDVALKSEAYFNIAVCNEKSCEFSKAISYCRSSQQISPKRSELSGQLYLCLGNSFLGTSEFLKAWNNLVLAMDEAKTTDDRVLELLTTARMGTLFTCLGDFERAITYCENALEILGGFMEDEPVLKYRRQILVYIATACKKLGRYSDAMNNCEDAMKVAMQYSDRPVQARCLFLFADIHRKGNDIERASPRYESAYSIMSEIGDRLGQVETLGGMAKLAALQKQYDKAIELNEKALDIATKFGCKLEMLRCHARLRLLGDVCDDTSRVNRHVGVMKQLVQEMDLYCGVCDDVLGRVAEKLEPLLCGHFIHAKCAIHLARSTLGRSGKRRPCPSCRRNAAQNPAWQETT